MRSGIFVVVAAVIVLTAFVVKNPFPAIQTKTVAGQDFSNENFKGKKTIVVMFHLGATGSMMLCRDLNELQATLAASDTQVIGIVENSTDQVLQFNSAEKNTWSDLRKYYRLQPFTFPIVAECSNPAPVVKEGGDVRMVSQCKMLANTLKVAQHPTVFLVNGSGDIYKKIDKYINYEDPAKRQAQILDKL